MNEKIRKMTFTAMLGAVATVLMFVDFSVPFMPSFIKMDISELPALIAGFAYGPISGVCVCLIKNLINLLRTTTSGVGELCNFMLGVAFILPSSIIYKKMKTRKGAVIGSVVGAVLMAVLSLPINYFITYPFYSNFMPIDVIISMYQEIMPSVDGLLACLIIFNVPFTLMKGVIDAIICFLIYKPLSPILHKKTQ
ncbi:MAG: ECF transporter S component [Acutalibacteraceae bacterium]